MRLFVAVWPSAEVISTLANLPRSSGPHIRWTTPEQWHVTLYFLGDLSSYAAGVATRRFFSIEREIVKNSLLPTTAQVGPVTGCFGNSILFVPVEGLDTLAVTVNRTFKQRASSRTSRGRKTNPDEGGRGKDNEVGNNRPRDCESKEKHFVGHITLARGRGTKTNLTYLAGRPVTARWGVDTLTLVESTLSQRGALYKILGEIPLRSS
ncbi:MAG: hypothetical protein M1483_01140 [Actinobacteria bacterium]|nr:hypothetical protein [Actinomycetota bacterium]MCL6104240.1 hypothetical protein [Actinomycetota bacterium]